MLGMAECAIQASSAEQANERAMQANDQINEQVTQYSHLIVLNHSAQVRWPEEAEKKGDKEEEEEERKGGKEEE